MKKKYVAITAYMLLIGCYFTVFALLVPEYSAVFFTVIGFDLVAIIAQIGSFCLFITEPPIEEYFYRIPAVYFGIIFGVVQFTVAFILAIVSAPMKLTLIIEISIVCIFGAIECYAVYVGMYAKSVNKKATESCANMRSICERAKAIMEKTTDYQWNRLVKVVFDEIRYANPTKQNETIERSLYIELGQLEDAVMRMDRNAYDQSFLRIKQMLADRNAG